MTSTAKMTDAERIAIQRAVTAEHIQAENDHDYDTVKATFVQDDRAYFDCVPGGIHFPGGGGVADWYEILATMLPDLVLEITHEYDTPGCSIREMTASGTHSAEYAGIKPEGRHISWEAIALYIFDEEDPGKLIAERAYWDNDALIRQMKGEEAPPTLGLLTNRRR